ncbi:MAG: hypothetical protein H7138_03000 [Myxococcales bacterium]|nr:hypothetical protein [Myxococcales bacterium]
MLAKARVVIVYGAARRYVWRLVAPGREYDEHCKVIGPGPGLILGHLRMVLFLPAPGSSGIRMLNKVLSGDDFSRARALVAADDAEVQRVAAQMKAR